MSFLRNILPSKCKTNVKIVSAKLGCKELYKIANSDVSKIENIIFVLDGDEQNKKKKKNICILPGKKSPEAVIYDFLSSKSIDSNFWNDYKPKNIYFNGYATRPGNRERFKSFFSHLKSIDSNLWKRFFRAWARENKKDVNEFIEDFNKKVAFLLKNDM